MAAALLVLVAAPGSPSARAQTPIARSAAQPAQDDELIVTLKANGVERGEVTVRRKPSGDYWLPAADLPRLKVEPVEKAKRQLGAETFYSVEALGASSVRFNEPDLTLEINFSTDVIAGTEIDLSNRAAPPILTPPNRSLILSYRLSASDSGQGSPTVVRMDNDLNVRVGGILLRQETRLLANGGQRRFTRGASQLIWDNRQTAQRYMAGDVFASAGAYGSAISGGGLLLMKLYDITPEVVRQPTATLRASTALPAQVEVAVDGNTIYRTDVGPGPITLNNLLLYGGTRNVRVTVTDVTGRREVFEQPFLFTDSVLARGLHEYSYFVGRRSELDMDNEWRYREGAWQAFHRYGLTDSITIGAGGEGSSEFASGGAGLTLRSDRLGLLSLDLLASRDRRADALARGWSARYTLVLPDASLTAGHRRFERGYRTFLTSPTAPFLLDETRVGGSVRLWQSTLAADWVRRNDPLETRTTRSLRLTTSVTANTTLSAEIQSSRVNGEREWAGFLFLRTELENRRWVGSSIRATQDSRTLDIETGRQLSEGEGVGYRLGLSAISQEGGDNSQQAFAAANWNLRPATLEFFGVSPVGGGGSGRYTEVAVSGAVVGVDGYWGLTRRVNDGFALARLGVPQAGVEISLNNQVQGTTDDKGQLFIPQVSSFGRQDVAFNHRQLGMQFTIPENRKSIAPPYRSGTVVDFAGKKLQAVAGMVWQFSAGRQLPVRSRAFLLANPAGTLRIETGSAGDFYLEDAPAGSYTGTLEADGRTYACRLTVPEFADAVLELKEGVICE